VLIIFDVFFSAANITFAINCIFLYSVVYAGQQGYDNVTENELSKLIFDMLIPNLDTKICHRVTVLCKNFEPI
jgi:hypothetical protein